MADIRYFKYDKIPIELTEFHTVTERWALETGIEALFMGVPNDAAVVGRAVPADLFHPSSGVSFCRLFQSQNCALFMDSDSILINISARANDVAGLTDKISAWLTAAFKTLRIDVKVGDFTVAYGGKIVGFISPPHESVGLFLSGAVIFFGYDIALAKNALSAQTVAFDKIGGLNDLGAGVTKPEVSQALELAFPAAFGRALAGEDLSAIMPVLIQLNADHLTAEWIERGVL